MNDSPQLADVSILSRREAIRRSALLLGVAISPSILTGVMQAQLVSRTSGRPGHLTAKQFQTAGAIAERILPRTDTPGATDVGVPAFIDLMYGKYMTAEEKQLFAAGLADVETTSQTEKKRDFAKLNETEQDAQLRQLAIASQAKEKTFFHQIKELTLVGYFSSEPVGKKILHYDPIPGRFEACVPISEVGNVSWTR